jgi:DNA-directed RNA polymerase specialized sigma subunit
MAKRPSKVRDRYWSEDLPSNNLDFIEVSVGDLETLDKYVNNSAAARQLLGVMTEDGAEQRERTKKKQKRLLRKVFQAASEVLTERQFQIFILRYLFNLTEAEIADRLTRQYVGRPRLDKKTKRAPNVKRISQPYCSQVLARSVQKIQEALRVLPDKED